MPQEFQVLQCFSCKTFQVHQVKKAKKWACKMCGEKQSIIKVYGCGTGAECRQHVQALNTHRGGIEQLKETLQFSENRQNSVYLENDSEDKNWVDSVREADTYDCLAHLCTKCKQSGSKWGQFVEEDTSGLDHLADDENEDQEDDAKFTTDASLLDRRKTSRKRKSEHDEHFMHRTKSIRYEGVAVSPTDNFSYEYEQAHSGHMDLKNHNNPTNGHFENSKNSNIKYRNDRPKYGCENTNAEPQTSFSVIENRQQMHSKWNNIQENDVNKDEHCIVDLRSDRNNYRWNITGRSQSKNSQNSTWNTNNDKKTHKDVSNIHHLMPGKCKQHKTSGDTSSQGSGGDNNDGDNVCGKDIKQIDNRHYVESNSSKWNEYTASGGASSQRSGGDNNDGDNICGRDIKQIDNRHYVESNSSKWNEYTASGGASSQRSGGDNNDGDNVCGKDIKQIDNRHYVESNSSKWNMYTASGGDSSHESGGDQVDDTIWDQNQTEIDTRPYVEFSKSDFDNNGCSSFPITSQRNTSGQEEEMSGNDGRSTVPPKLDQFVDKKQTSSSKWDLFVGTCDSNSGETCSSLANNRTASRSVDGDITENLKNQSDRLQREVISVYTGTSKDPLGARSLNVYPQTSGDNDYFIETDPKLYLANKTSETQDSKIIKRKDRKDVLPVQIHTNASSVFSVGDLTDDDFQL